MKSFILLLTLLSLAFAQTPNTQTLLREAEQFASQARAQKVAPSPDSLLWKQAIAKAEEATQLEPAASEPWRLLASYYTEVRFWIRADEAWAQYLRRGTPDERTGQLIAQTQMNLGYAAYRQENYEEASTRFENAAEFDAKSAAPLEWQGRIALEQGNLQAARGFYQRAVQVAPNETNRYFLNQAQTMQAYGKDAVRAFLQAYDSYQVGNKEESLQGFVTVSQAAPQWTEAKRWVGRLQLELNQAPQALNTWRQLSLAPGTTAADRYFLRYAELGSQYGVSAAKSFLDGVNAFEINKSGAITFFQRAISANPAFADAWYWLGRSAFETKNYAQAVDAYSRVLQIQPDNRDAQYWLNQARKAMNP